MIIPAMTWIPKENTVINLITFPAIEPFPVTNTSDKTKKAQALKVLEEASELVEAVKDKDEDDVLWEFCDVLQALGNLAAVYGWKDNEIFKSYLDVRRSNVSRGRYEPKEDPELEIDRSLVTDVLSSGAELLKRVAESRADLGLQASMLGQRLDELREWANCN